MIDQFFRVSWIKKKPATSLYLGVILTLLGYFTSYFLFNAPSQQHFIGISTILFTVILTLPTLNALYAHQEKVDTRSKHFLKKHAAIIDFFIYYFIGVFITLFVLSLFQPLTVFSEQHLSGQISEVDQAVSKKIDPRLPPPPPTPILNDIWGIFSNNLYVMLLAFVLSLFYGAGAVFLIVLNASIFASTLANVIRIKLPSASNFVYTYFFMSCNLGVIFFHMLPEVSGYLLAAIAGGVLSKAIDREKFMSKRFKKVVGTSIKLLLGSIVLLLIAAFIEVQFSKSFFENHVCREHNFWIGVFFIVIIALIFVFEYWRKKNHK